MGAIVGGVILFVIGAIVAFALQIDLQFIDGTMLGYILMGAGALLFLVGLIVSLTSRRTVVERHTDDRGTVAERRDY